MTSVEYIPSYLIVPNEKNLLQNLKFSSSGTRRICLHKNEEAPFHVMLIELAPDVTFPRHKHTDSDELTIVISGQMTIEYWQNENEKKVKVNLGKYNKAAFIKAGKFHRNSSGKNGCMYLEVKLGPFNPEKMVLGEL